MSLDNFDEHIRQSLHDHPSEVDGEAIWQAIKPRRRRKAAIWWWSAGLLVAALGLGVLYQGLRSTSEARPKAESSTEVSTPPTPAAPASLSSAVATAPSAEPQTSTPVAAKATVVRSEYKRGQSISTDLSSPRPTSEDPSLARPQQVAPSAGTPAGVSTNKWVEPVAENTPTGRLQLAQPSSPVQSGSPEKSSTYPSWLVAPVASLYPAGLPIPPRKEPLALLPSAAPKTAASKWSIGLAGLAYLPIRNLENKEDSLSDSWRNQRSETEIPLEVVGGELSIGYQIKPKWRLQTGLAYTRLSEKFEWAVSSSQVDSIEGIQSIFIDAGGDSTFVYGPIARYQSSRYYKRTYNSYTLLDVPFLAVYESGSGDFSLNLQAGAYLNVQMKAEGDRLGPDGLFESLEEQTDYRSSLGLSFHAAGGLSWRPSARLSLEALATLRYFPGSFTTEEAAVRQSYQWIGAKLGVRYHLR